MTLGQIIKAYRDEHGLSQDAIAEKANLSKGPVGLQMAERKKRNTTAHEAVVFLACQVVVVHRTPSVMPQARARSRTIYGAHPPRASQFLTVW